MKIFDNKLLFWLVFRSFPDWLRMVFGGQTIRVLPEEATKISSYLSEQTFNAQIGFQRMVFGGETIRVLPEGAEGGFM